MAKTNKEILNQLRDNASTEYQSNILEATDTVGLEVYQALNNYPTARNEFLNTLTNRVIKTVFFSKVFNNPLKMLHKGVLEFGTSVEQLFVEMAERRGFGENFTGNSTVEADLIRKQVADVKALYISKNYAYKYKVSISEEQLRGAFTNANGLSNLIDQLLASELNRAYVDEYEDMLSILHLSAQYKKGVLGANGLKEEQELTAQEAKQGMAVVKLTSGKASDIVKKIRALSGDLSFMSSAYNMAGVKTFSKPEDLVFITTPTVNAELDVDVMAHAFNVSSADIKQRIILVDRLPKATEVKTGEGGSESATSSINHKVIGFLVDKEFIQAYDTVNTTKTFENGVELLTNVFLHKQGIMATCLFANCVCLIDASQE